MTELPAINELSAIPIGMVLVGEKEGAAQCREILGGLEEKTPDFRIAYAHNTADELNIAVPHYSQLDEIMSSAVLSEEEMAKISGGEIFATIILVAKAIAGAIGVAVGAGISAGTGLAVGGGVVGGGMVAGGLAVAVGGAVLGGIAVAGIATAGGVAVGTGMALGGMGAPSGPANVGLPG